MRFQDALLLQKQQAEQEASHQEAQERLEQVARHVEDHYQHWLRFRDPFAESMQRIQDLYCALTGNKEDSGSGGSTNSLRVSLHSNKSLTDVSGGKEVTVQHENGPADLDPTTFNLFRRLKHP